MSLRQSLVSHATTFFRGVGMACDTTISTIAHILPRPKTVASKQGCLDRNTLRTT